MKHTTTTSLAARVGVSRTRIAQLIKAGQIRAVRLTPRSPWRIPVEEADRFAQAVAP